MPNNHVSELSDIVLDMAADPPQLIDDAGPYRQGAWFVVVDGDERLEIPIPLPRVDADHAYDRIQEHILSLDADALWDDAINGAALGESPAARLLQLIAEAVFGAVE